jgi:hypothetical protein
MWLEEHTKFIEHPIQGSHLVSTYSLKKVQLSANTGYVEGEIVFIDGSRLIFFEFRRSLANDLKREKYRYHFMDMNNELIFRYDNAPHHPNISSFPDHKHLPSDVVASSAPQFSEIFAEVEAYLLHIV